MQEKPFFSIVIPTYNRATDLEFALFCIFRQNFSNFEVVISDNCSTDETKKVVKKFDNKKIRYFKNKKNVKMIDNQRKAVEYANGKYIFIHSDDDFLLYEDTLQTVYAAIKKNKPGYLRVSYVSLSMDRKRIFNYIVNKPFNKDKYFSPNQKNKKVLAFIIDTDPYFITGIVFKNNLSSKVKIVDTDPTPWIDVLFYNTKEYGAYFISQPQIVAAWSRREIKKNSEHHFFNLTQGKLVVENFFNSIAEKVTKKEYHYFLHDQLMIFYIRLLPVIKMHVGNKKTLEICKRIKELDPKMSKTFIYWAYLIPSLLLPRSILKLVRDVLLYMYTIISKVENNSKIVENMRIIVLDYQKKMKTKRIIFRG